MGDHIDGTRTNLTIGQFLESFLCDVEARTGGVDSDQVDRRVRGRVGQAPAPAAVGRVEDDVKGAADEGERGHAAEGRESRCEPVDAVGTRDVVHRPGTVVVRGIERDTRRYGWGWQRRRTGGRRWTP